MVHKLPVSLLLMTGMLVLATASGTVNSVGDLAVIANKKTALLALTSRDLRSILLGQKEQWTNGQRVLAASLPLEAPETKLVLKEICGMSEAAFRRYYMQLTFQGKSAVPPRFVTSPLAVKAIVMTTPGALGIIRASDVDQSVNVISLDGRLPGAPNYKLAMRY